MLSQQSSQQAANNDSKSEVGKLQVLPGYSRMQRALFFNLMSARPDVSEKNIRIRIAEGGDNHKKQINFGEGTGGGADDNPGISGHKNKSKSPGVESSSTLGMKDDDLRLPTTSQSKAIVVPLMDRDTVKNVSKLVIDRDYQKFANKLKEEKTQTAQVEYKYVPMQPKPKALA